MKPRKARIVDDLRDIPAYTIGEAAQYLRLPKGTLSSWALGRTYPTRSGTARALPPLVIAGKNPAMLSFTNLVEAHILAAITRVHEIPLQRARRAMRYLQRRFESAHPLIDQTLYTDRRDLFIRDEESLISVTREGQVAIDGVLDTFLSRIEWDEDGLAARLFPFTARLEGEAPRAVVIDPRVAFGKPVLAGTSIATLVVAERFKGGESVAALAEDYGREPAEIQEAIRCELAIAA